MRRSAILFASLGITFAALVSANVWTGAAEPGAVPSPAPAVAPQAAPAPQPAPAAPRVAGTPAPARLTPPTPTPQPTAQPVKRSYRPLPPPTDFSPPVIQIAAADYDWGTVLQGEAARHDFIIENKGGSPLTVTQVKTSCGCTMASKPEKPIEPGQSGVVTLEVDTKRFSGAIKKTADIFSNSQPSPFRISIGGKVEPFYTLDPAAPRIDVVKGVPPAPIKVTLRRNPNAAVKFTVKEISTTSKILSAKITEVQAGELYEIEISANLPADEARKYFYERVTLNLEVNGKVHDAGFNVSVTVKERIDVKPRASIYFSRNETKPLKDSQGATPVSKTLDIESLGGAEHSFQITGVTVEPIAAATPPTTPTATPAAPPAGPTYFETKVEPVEAGKKYRLTVLLSKLPPENVRTIREKLILKTDDPTVKEIPITAMASIY